MTLATTHRPRRFADVVGQPHVVPVLRAMTLNQDRVPPAIILVGTRGTGKTTTGRILAAALNCDNPEGGDSCGTCPTCAAVQKGNFPSVQEIDAASHGGVGDIRKLKEVVQYSHGGKWWVILLDEAHSMSKDAFNALLKVLEEPPPHTLFILLTTERHKILETVQSRSMTFDFRRITEVDIEARLRHIAEQESIEVSDALLREIAHRSQGGMRDAIMTLDQVSQVGLKTVEEYQEMFGVRNVSVQLFQAALAGDFATGSALVEDHFQRMGEASGLVNDLTLLVRDLLVVHAGGDHPDVALLEPLRQAADIVRLTETIRVLWDLRAKVRAVDNDQRAAMHMAFVLISEALRPKAPVSPEPIQGVAATNGGRRLSLSEMKVVAGGGEG